MNQRRGFNRLLHKRVREGVGASVTALPTPQSHAHNNAWIRDAAAGRRSREWEETPDPVPESNQRVNDALRDAIRESRGEPHR